MSIALIIVALALAMAIGPMLLLRPTGRQRRQVKLRDYALTKGLRVQLMPTPEVVMKATPDLDSAIAVYSLPWRRKSDDTSPWLLVKGAFEHELHFCGKWQWANPTAAAAPNWHAPLRELLNRLPDSVVAVGNGPQGLHLYWREQGGTEAIDQFSALLPELAQKSGDA